MSGVYWFLEKGLKSKYFVELNEKKESAYELFLEGR